MGYFYSDEELAHHGILGQKWGVRRFENKDGTLTPAGRSRYDTDGNGDYKKLSDKQKHAFSAKATAYKIKGNIHKARAAVEPEWGRRIYEKAYAQDAFYEAEKAQKKADAAAKKKAAEKEASGKSTMKESLSDPRVKKAAIIGAAAVGTALVAYGGYKLAKSGAIQKAAANAKFKAAEVQKSKAANMAKNAAKAERLGMDAGKQMAKADKLAESAKKTAQEASKMKSPVLKEQYKKMGVDYDKALKETERAAKNLADKKQADIAKKAVKTVSEGFQSSSPAKFEFEKFMPEKFDFEKFEYENNELVDGLLKKNARMLGL